MSFIPGYCLCLYRQSLSCLIFPLDSLDFFFVVLHFSTTGNIERKKSEISSGRGTQYPINTYTLFAFDKIVSVTSLVRFLYIM